MKKTMKLNEIVDHINSDGSNASDLVLEFDKATVSWTMNGKPIVINLKGDPDPDKSTATTVTEATGRGVAYATLDAEDDGKSNVTVNTDHVSSGIAYYISHASDKVAIGSGGEVNYHATIKVKAIQSGESGSIFIHGHFYSDNEKSGTERYNIPTIEYDDGL